MADAWDFWKRSLAGECPETTPGTPHHGFYIVKRYVSIPGGAKRVLTDFPVAIWQEDGAWFAQVHDLLGAFNTSQIDEVDDIFASCCRSPITLTKFVKMKEALALWRKSDV